MIQDLITPVLKEIYKKDTRGTLKELDILKRTLVEGGQRDHHKSRQYDYEITLAFWFALHSENLEIANKLLKRELLLRKLVVAIQKKKIDLVSSMHSRISSGGSPFNAARKKSSYTNEFNLAGLGVNQSGFQELAGKL